MLFPPSTCYIPHFFSNSFLGTSFSSAFILGSSLSARDQVSHPHKTTHKIIIPYTVIRDSKRLTQFRTSIFPELYMVCE